MSRSERKQHRHQENQMIKARKERVRELIRSLESVQVRSPALGKQDSAFEGRSSFLMEPGGRKNDAEHSPREAGDDVQSATDHTKVAIGDESTQACPNHCRPVRLTPRRYSSNAGSICRQVVRPCCAHYRRMAVNDALPPVYGVSFGKIIKGKRSRIAWSMYVNHPLWRCAIAREFHRERTAAHVRH